jgi:hypothetical protein
MSFDISLGEKSSFNISLTTGIIPSYDELITVFDTLTIAREVHINLSDGMTLNDIFKIPTGNISFNQSINIPLKDSYTKFYKTFDNKIVLKPNTYYRISGNIKTNSDVAKYISFKSKKPVIFKGTIIGDISITDSRAIGYPNIFQMSDDGSFLIIGEHYDGPSISFDPIGRFRIIKNLDFNSFSYDMSVTIQEDTWARQIELVKISGDKTYFDHVFGKYTNGVSHYRYSGDFSTRDLLYQDQHLLFATDYRVPSSILLNDEMNKIWISYDGGNIGTEAEKSPRTISRESATSWNTSTTLNLFYTTEYIVNLLDIKSGNNLLIERMTYDSNIPLFYGRADASLATVETFNEKYRGIFNSDYSKAISSIGFYYNNSFGSYPNIPCLTLKEKSPYDEKSIALYDKDWQTTEYSYNFNYKNNSFNEFLLIPNEPLVHYNREYFISSNQIFNLEYENNLYKEYFYEYLQNLDSSFGNSIYNISKEPRLMGKIIDDDEALKIQTSLLFLEYVDIPNSFKGVPHIIKYIQDKWIYIVSHQIKNYGGYRLLFYEITEEESDATVVFSKVSNSEIIDFSFSFYTSSSIHLSLDIASELGETFEINDIEINIEKENI